MVKLKKKKNQPCGLTVKPTRQLYCKIVPPYIHSYIHISQEFLGVAIFHALYIVVSKAWIHYKSTTLSLLIKRMNKVWTKSKEVDEKNK